MRSSSYARRSLAGQSNRISVNQTRLPAPTSARTAVCPPSSASRSAIRKEEEATRSRMKGTAHPSSCLELRRCAATTRIGRLESSWRRWRTSLASSDRGRRSAAIGELLNASRRAVPKSLVHSLPPLRKDARAGKWLASLAKCQHPGAGFARVSRLYARAPARIPLLAQFIREARLNRSDPGCHALVTAGAAFCQQGATISQDFGTDDLWIPAVLAARVK